MVPLLVNLTFLEIVTEFFLYVFTLLALASAKIFPPSSNHLVVSSPLCLPFHVSPSNGRHKVTPALISQLFLIVGFLPT